MNTPLQKLGLSASQFGLDQPAPARGRSPQAEAREILSIAARAQLPVLDVSHIHGHAETELSQLLPQVVDKLTPQGQLPQQADLGSLLGGSNESA